MATSSKSDRAPTRSTVNTQPGWPTLSFATHPSARLGAPFLAFFARSGVLDLSSFQSPANVHPPQAILRVLLILLRTRNHTHFALAFPIPALRKEREGRGTPLLAAKAL